MRIKEWNELANFQTPQWMKKAKFGIYTHWGVYSVAAFGINVSWYPCCMYYKGTEQYDYHCKTFGDPREVGYKDLIPRFTGEKFDADEWADLFCKAGARFAGPVAEHHDGFSLWDSQCNEWNAAKMGPKKNIVGELEAAIRKRGMNFMTSFHHAENWIFYPHWIPGYDTSDPKYAGLYGEQHNLDLPYKEEGYTGEEIDAYIHTLQDHPSKEFHEMWFAKLKEVIDAYHPDYIWFDFGIQFINDVYKRKFMTYYQESAKEYGQEVAVSYKWRHLPAGTALLDVEQGSFDNATYHDWITDTTIDTGYAWGYMQGAKYKSAKALIHYLIDNVSKNGYLLLNVGPKPDGSIPEEAKKVLLEMGEWLNVNGEAVYDTITWRAYGEGPTKHNNEGAFADVNRAEFTAEDIRYTAKDSTIYATALGKIGDEVILNHIFPNESGYVYEEEIEKISVIGDGKALNWRKDGERLIVDTKAVIKNEIANVIKIERKNLFA